MNIYADTNFFTSLYCTGPNHAEALRLDQTAEEHGCAGYPMTLLGRLEFVNAFHQSVFSTRNGIPGVHLTPEMALVIEAKFHEHLLSGDLLRQMSCDERRLERQFKETSHRHTAKEGFRTYDILHVSSALVLGCDTFWSFDAKAKKLAKLEGLKAN